IATFGIDMSRLHWDMASISLFGDYDQPDEDYARPRYGKPKDRRPDLTQIQTGLAVSGDGGIPVFHRAYDGGAGEVNQVVGAMEALRGMAGQRRFLLVVTPNSSPTPTSKRSSTPRCASWPRHRRTTCPP